MFIVKEFLLSFQEGEKYKEGVDPDSFTRGQQKKIEEIQNEKPEPKKPRMAKEGTMEVTAKVHTHTHTHMFWVLFWKEGRKCFI